MLGVYLNVDIYKEDYEEKLIEKLCLCTSEQLRNLFEVREKNDGIYFFVKNDPSEYVIISNQIKDMNAYINANFAHFQKTLGSNNYDELFLIAYNLLKAFEKKIPDDLEKQREKCLNAIYGSEESGNY